MTLQPDQINPIGSGFTTDFRSTSDPYYDPNIEPYKIEPWTDTTVAPLPSTQELAAEEIARLKIIIEDLRLRLEAIESMPIFKTLKRLTKTNETKKEQP